MLRGNAHLMLATCGIVLLAACNGSTGEEHTNRQPSAAVSTSASAMLSQPELMTALITKDDLPPGFLRDTSLNDSDDEALSGCKELDAIEDDGGNYAEASFMKGESGPFISEGIGQAPSEREANEALNRVRDTMRNCRRFTVSNSEVGKVDIASSAIPFPKLGDETRAVRFDISIDGVKGATLEAVVIQDGSNVILIVHGAAGSADTRFTETLSGKALAKLRRQRALKAGQNP